MGQKRCLPGNARQSRPFVVQARPESPASPAISLYASSKVFEWSAALLWCGKGDPDSSAHATLLSLTTKISLHESTQNANSKKVSHSSQTDAYLGSSIEQHTVHHLASHGSVRPDFGPLLLVPDDAVLFGTFLNSRS